MGVKTATFLKLLLAIVVLAGVIWGVSWLVTSNTGDDENLIAHTVSRRTVRDLVIERGTLESQKTCLLYTSPSPRD